MKQNNRNALLDLISVGRIKQENIEEVLTIANLKPTSYEFLVFLRTLLVWVGAISLIMSLLFFMAFNWGELGHFTKFMIVESIMLLSVLSYLFLDKFELLKKVSLMLSSISLGILLALIGQTYQTGADPWQLFAVWALFMTPWAVVASFSGLWILWILLINLGALLFFQKFDLSIFALFEVQNTLLLLTFTLNTTLWILWEFLAPKYETFRSQISINFLAFFSLASVSTLVIFNLFEFSEGRLALYFVLYVLTLASVYYIYRIREVNLYMMSLYALSLFFLSISLLIRFMFEIEHDFVVGTILTLALIIGLTTFIVSWMKKLRKELS